MNRQETKLIEITIDDPTYSVEQKVMGMGDLLALAGKDPGSYYLVEIKGKKDREKYTDPGAPIKLHTGSKFVTVFRGETPVS